MNPAPVVWLFCLFTIVVVLMWTGLEKFNIVALNFSTKFVYLVVFMVFIGFL